MNFVFSFFFTMIGIISWVYPAEIFPFELRAKSNAVSTFSNWSLNLVFAQVSPIALSSIGFRFFFFFFVFNMIAAACYFFFYPETKGRTLEQMDEIFGVSDVQHYHRSVGLKCGISQDQLVPHALDDPMGATKAMELGNVSVVDIREERS